MAGGRLVSGEVCAVTGRLGLAPHTHIQIDACHVETLMLRMRTVRLSAIVTADSQLEPP